jgi:hypothetical protein
MNCQSCGQSLASRDDICPRCGATGGRPPARPAVSWKVVAPALASLVVISFGVLFLAGYARGAATGGLTRAQWTPTPTTQEGITADALRSYAKANFGTVGSKGGVAEWWPSVIGFEVQGAYAVAHTTLDDLAKDIKMATDICVALVYFANDRTRLGTRLSSVRVVGKGDVVIIDTTADTRETDPCQAFRARPTRARS